MSSQPLRFMPILTSVIGDNKELDSLLGISHYTGNSKTNSHLSCRICSTPDFREISRMGSVCKIIRDSHFHSTLSYSLGMARLRNDFDDRCRYVRTLPNGKKLPYSAARMRQNKGITTLSEMSHTFGLSPGEATMC